MAIGIYIAMAGLIFQLIGIIISFFYTKTTLPLWVKLWLFFSWLLITIGVVIAFLTRNKQKTGSYIPTPPWSTSRPASPSQAALAQAYQTTPLAPATQAPPVQPQPQVVVQAPPQGVPQPIYQVPVQTQIRQ